jgi:hypothetical protein
MDPLSAEAFKDGEPLGTSPVVVDVPEGKTVSLEIRHKGHKTKTIQLDGSEKKVAVKLDPIRKPRKPPTTKKAKRPKPKAPKKKKKIGGGEIVDPWN